MLVACYTGAIDARDDSLAEELVLDEQGPVAVIAATRVTMPYGNTVSGLRTVAGGIRATGCDARRSLDAGPAANAGRRGPDDSLRTSLDSLARGVSPPPVDLAAERREHVLLYQLLGRSAVAAELPTARPQSAPPPARIAVAPAELRPR